MKTLYKIALLSLVITGATQPASGFFESLRNKFQTQGTRKPSWTYNERSYPIIFGNPEANNKKHMKAASKHTAKGELPVFTAYNRPMSSLEIMEPRITNQLIFALTGYIDGNHENVRPSTLTRHNNAIDCGGFNGVPKVILLQNDITTDPFVGDLIKNKLDVTRFPLNPCFEYEKTYREFLKKQAK